MSKRLRDNNCECNQSNSKKMKYDELENDFVEIYENMIKHNKYY